MPIIMNLRLCCWITTLVVLFVFHCVLEVRCGWVWVVPVLQDEVTSCSSSCNTDTTQTQQHQISNTQRNKNKPTNVVIQQHSRKLLMMDILMSETCLAHKKWNKNNKWHQVGLSFFSKVCKETEIGKMWYLSNFSGVMNSYGKEIDICNDYYVLKAGSSGREV